MRNLLGAERLRLRKLGILPQPVPYGRPSGPPPVQNYVVDRWTGETVAVVKGGSLRVNPKSRPSSKPPFVPFSTLDPVTGERQSGYTVRPPGWEQFVLIDPILGTSPEAIRARKRQMAEQIGHSPTPHIVQGLAYIMTQIDNVQDAAVTLAVGGRLAARFFPKIIPGVGIISTVADVLAIGGHSHACGWFASIGGVIPCKNNHESAGKSTQQTYRKRLAEQIRTGKFRIGWGEIFQILQTTASLVDVGLEIGAGLGYAVDLAFGLIRGADIVLPCWASWPADAITRLPGIVASPCAGPTSEEALGVGGFGDGPLHFRTIGILGHLDKAFGLPVGTIDQKIGAASQWVLDAGKRALQGWPIVGMLQDDLSFDEHLSVMYTLFASQQAVADVAERYDLQPIIDYLYEHGSISAPAVRDRDTWDAIKAAGGNPGDPRLPVYGSPREMPYREFIGEAREEWARSWRSWLARAPSIEKWWYATQLLDKLFDVQVWALEGPGVQFETAFTPEMQATINMIEAGVRFPGTVSQLEAAERVRRVAVRLNPPSVTKLSLREMLPIIGLSDGGYLGMAGRKIVERRAS